MIRALAVVLVLIGSEAVADSEPALTVRGLQGLCLPSSQAEDAGLQERAFGTCFGYLSGTADMVRFLREIGSAQICIPNDAEVRALRGVFLAWAANNLATSQDEPAAPHVVQAYRAAYPCS